MGKGRRKRVAKIALNARVGTPTFAGRRDASVGCLRLANVAVLTRESPSEARVSSAFNT
jgi:hypothetical protein